jgi:cob(I)alamin adenosyltransferase
MRISKVYTRNGDLGNTRLANGKEVPKDYVSIHAYGDIDELNSILGFVQTLNLSDKSKEIIQTIQNVLFNVGGELSFDGEMQLIHSIDVEKIEKWIDEINGHLLPLKEFIIPGGSAEAAQLHIARSVARRAERSILKIQDWQTKHLELFKYVNRLSDLLFVMARYENKLKKIDEPLWTKLNQ